MTFAIFISGVLIATLELSEVGGFLLLDGLTEDPEMNLYQMRNFFPRSKYKPNPLYTFENTIRLVFIGSSIAFFIQFLILEMVQAFFAIGTLLGTRICECIDKVARSSK